MKPRTAMRRIYVLFVCIYLLSISLPVSADDAGRKARVEVIVAQLSNQVGKIDKRAKRLHRELKDQFRYSSIEVVDMHRFELAVDDIGQRKLPNGRVLMIRPLLLEKKSGLLSVDLSGLMQTDLRLQDDQLVIIGAEKHRDGRLVVALEFDIR